MHLTGARRLWNSRASVFSSHAPTVVVQASRLCPPCQAPKGCVPRSKGCQVGHNGCVHCSVNADIQLRNLRHDHCCIGVVTEVQTATLHGMSVSDRRSSAFGGVQAGQSSHPYHGEVKLRLGAWRSLS